MNLRQTAELTARLRAAVETLRVEPDVAESLAAGAEL
jgi:hypothetical protein